MLLQGTTLSAFANWLDLEDKSQTKFKGLSEFDVEFADEIKSITTEITLTEESLSNGAHLMDLAFPEKTLVAMVKRGKKYFVPTGKTLLQKGDKLLVLSDNHEELLLTYKNLGIKH